MDKELLAAIAKITIEKFEYAFIFPAQVSYCSKFFLDYTDTVHYNDWLARRKIRNAANIST